MHNCWGSGMRSSIHNGTGRNVRSCRCMCSDEYSCQTGCTKTVGAVISERAVHLLPEADKHAVLVPGAGVTAVMLLFAASAWGC